MAQYLRVVRRGKHNVRVELPDHTTQLVPVAELPLWELVVALANNTAQPATNTEAPVTAPESSDNDGQEPLTLDAPESDTSDAQVPSASPSTDAPAPKRRGRKPKSAQATDTQAPVQGNTNGLGVDHPYETVDTNVEAVAYNDEVEAPF